MQPWEPSDLRGLFLSAPTTVMSSSLHTRASISVSSSSVQPLWKLSEKGAWFTPGTAYIPSLLFLFLPSQSLLPFLLLHCLSRPVWGYLRLTIITTTHRGCSQHLEDHPLFLHLTCPQAWDWCCCFLLCPMPVALWERWSSNADGQLQAGTDSEKQFPVPF